VVLIVLVGVGLGLGYNALGLGSRPPRGLSWITRQEKMPSLEELQPGSRAIPPPARGRRAAPALALVGTAWAQDVTVLATAADTVRVVHAKTSGSVVKKKMTSKKVTSKPVRTPVPKPVMRPAGAAPTPATPPSSVTPPTAAKVDLPVVPDLTQPIEVKLPNVKKFFDAGAAVLVDAREASEYAEGHIAGALSVPLDDAVAKPALLEPFKKAGKPIIAYCSGGDCEESKDLAKNMLAAGIHRVLVFTDGFPAWKAAGYPVETGAAKAGR
jgi:rhodanese-related sulfurtransferase